MSERISPSAFSPKRRNAGACSIMIGHARRKEISCIRIHLCLMKLHLSLARELVYCRALRQSSSFSGVRKTRNNCMEVSPPAISIAPPNSCDGKYFYTLVIRIKVPNIYIISHIEGECYEL